MEISIVNLKLFVEGQKGIDSPSITFQLDGRDGLQVAFVDRIADEW